ncbi:hypothetical protein INR77_07585 [Erythrobacter sp. SCSIO 43205]|uniref:Rossmann fold domain-containing protein n=1 Tax=Erythrobacter sp. SCSIO 43205 TaxID=2779361 RepID=UPI001CA8057E|nr:hypothetical protein [Erythrobacter sp. SCSIO 43205]UAB79509.1 hypothetical protein INR77_07585 [Erythrobacter sp. SCSIO 43205]
MAQAEYIVSDLPDSPLKASACFYGDHLQSALAARGAEDLLVILPSARHEHTDWRQALARDLARECAPARANVIAAGDEAQKDELCRYLAGASGVTGQYCQTND